MPRGNKSTHKSARKLAKQLKEITRRDDYRNTIEAGNIIIKRHVVDLRKYNQPIQLTFNF